MPIAITGLDAAGVARPVVSVLVELGSALHVLRDPSHHDAARWAAGVRAAMSSRLVQATESWLWTTQAIRSTPFVTVSSLDEDFRGRLEQLRALPPRRLAGLLLRPISPSGDTRLALRWSRSRGPAVTTLVETLVERPDAAVDDFLRFLELSWQEWFSSEWRRIQPILAARARRFTDTVSAHGAAVALATLDSSVTAAGTGGGVTIAKVQNIRHDVSRRGLQVAPSTFIRPHLYVADVPGQPLLLIHPVEAGPPVPSVAELLGRLEVARAIATEPRTAGEVAALWNIDPTLVNRHLRSLASAGLALTTRRGRFVQYRLDMDAVQALGTDLASLLLR